MPPPPSLHVILPQNNGAKILLLPSESGWTLPMLKPEKMWERPYMLFEAGMETQFLLGQEVIPLRCAYFEYAHDEQSHQFVFVMESRAETFPLPDGARWIEQGELDQLPLAPEHLRPILDAYFREQATGEIPPQRTPWAYPGWQARAVDWIKAQIAAQGWQLTGVVELRRKWCITCVMCAPTNIGDIYFKAVPPTFAREIAITRFLSERYPDHVPSIVAYHEAERWILLRDFGGQLLGESKEIAHWERAVREFAALQIDMMGQVDALFERGALDYRLEVLGDKLDALLVDDTVLRPNYQITAEEIERVRSLTPRIKALIDELRAYAIPSTITHSDFHPWNSALQDGRTIFFDWTDASVGQPFLDIGYFFERVSQEIFTDAPQTVGHLQSLYLQALTAVAPLETLEKALTLGEGMGMLHQAINYRHLLHQIEPSERWMLDITGSFVKRLLLWVEARG